MHNSVYSACEWKIDPDLDVRQQFQVILDEHGPMYRSLWYPHRTERFPKLFTSGLDFDSTIFYKSKNPQNVHLTHIKSEKNNPKTQKKVEIEQGFNFFFPPSKLRKSLETWSAFEPPPSTSCLYNNFKKIKTCFVVGMRAPQWEF